MVPPPDDDSDFPDSVAVPVRTTRSTKRKLEATSDISDADLNAPAKKRWGPKPKVTLSGPESKPKLPRKKPGPKPKPKTEDIDSDDNAVELVKSALTPPNIVFMIPEATTEGSQHVLLKSLDSFDDAIEFMHKTIDCVSVERKPMLAYKFSTANKNAATINLRTETFNPIIMDSADNTMVALQHLLTISPQRVEIIADVENTRHRRVFGQFGK
ncbi:hypothetical protein DFH07DRAFT_784241 [Mycena maculata]|uniref:Uncharacterized protein n=1 Tax=Mycena maculata TaxID=230809 RepID=A0AAD7MJX3_9AGAR|nr:hypothetical protein DFH07DRAFT_784241 [Mycena maculata]